MSRHVAAILASCLAESVPPRAEEEEVHEVHFLRDVRPIFAEACFVCHGSMRAEAGLRMDKREDVLGDRRGRALVVPGAPDESLLMHRLSSRIAPMPPLGVGASGVEATDADPAQVDRDRRALDRSLGLHHARAAERT